MKLTGEKLLFEISSNLLKPSASIQVTHQELGGGLCMLGAVGLSVGPFFPDYYEFP